MAQTNRLSKASDEQLETMVDKNKPGTAGRLAILQELSNRRRGAAEDRKGILWISLGLLISVLLAAWLLLEFPAYPPAKTPPTGPPPSRTAPANPSTVP